MKIIKIQSSNYYPWWNNRGEDFPNLHELNNFFDSFIDSIYKLNFISHYKAQVVINIKDMNIIGSFRILYADNLVSQVYIVKSIDKIMENGTAILNLELDIYSSYAYKLLDPKFYNDKYKFLVKRTHRFNPLYFQINDNLLDSIPIYYDNNIILENLYTDENGDTTFIPISIKSKTGIRQGKFRSYINSNIYYVFGCGLDAKDTTKFTMVPLMSIDSNIPQVSSPSTDPVELQTINYYDNSEWKDVLDRITYWESQGYKNIQMDIKSKFNYQGSNDMINIRGYDYTKSNYDIKIVFYQRKYRRSDPNFLFWQNWSFTENTLKVRLYNNDTYRDLKHTEQVWKASGSQGDFLPYPTNNYWTPTSNRYLQIKLFGAPAGLQNKNVKNTKTNIETILLKDPDLINKFQGIYFLPNIANFTIIPPDEIVGKFKDYVCFEIGTDGADFKSFTIANQLFFTNKQEQTLTWNNNNITSIIFLKFLDITYYSNIKDWNFYYNYENASLDLSGKFFFNGNGVIVSNVGIDKTYNNVINFPYQLPSAIDKYIQYYSGIMSSINTGIEGQKKSYEISKNQNMTNALTNGISGAMGLIGNMVSGNVAGSIGSAVGLGGNIANSVFNRQSLDLQNEMYYKRLGSQFEDTQRTQSASFNTSATSDLSFIYSNFGEKNAESIQLKKLTDNSITNINNMIYLYGYQNIGWYGLKDLFIYDTFNYVEFETNEITRFILNNMTFNIKEQYDIVISFWKKGKRLWNTIPSYNDNNLTPESKYRTWKIN